MKIELIASTDGLVSADEMIAFGLRCARVCYSAKSWEELESEEMKPEFRDRLINSGHHSVFEHMNLTFYLESIPKALAMVLNNEKQYATSEKSARYTVMSTIEPRQKKLFDRWLERLIPKIEEIYPPIPDEEARAESIRKLAQENARYLTSVFTPTKMVYTMNLRQLNFIQQQFESYCTENTEKSDAFRSRLIMHMQDFLKQTKHLRVDGLDNQTDRRLSLFNEDLKPSRTHGDLYSRTYQLSFAGLAQIQRHRTISYTIVSGTELGSTQFFIPQIIEHAGLKEEWLRDLEELAKTDFPQAQLVTVYERGKIEDFRSKALLRICGHAQWEAMHNTLETATKYRRYKELYGRNALNPKCLQGMRCASPCIWKGKKATSRIV